MAYIGTSPSNGVRRIFDYTATAGQTSFSGSDNSSQTLNYADSTYIDVFQNGILLVPSDYTATTGTTVVLDTGATVSDSVQVVAYDIFSVADTVSAGSGGSFGGNIGIGGTLAVTGVPTFTGRSVHSGGITVANAGQIGSVGDADAIAIASNGVVTFSQAPIGTGMRLLLNATISSAVAQYDISSTYINSTYDSYKLIFNLLPATDNVDLHTLFFVSGSVVTDSHYGYNSLAMYSDSPVVTNINAAAFIELNNQKAGNAAGEGVCGFGELTNVNSTISRTSLSGIVSVASNGALPKASVYNGMFLPAQRANVVNGLRLKFSSGNIASGTVQIYGISK